jgi:hypothetical protein
MAIGCGADWASRYCGQQKVLMFARENCPRRRSRKAQELLSAFVKGVADSLADSRIDVLDACSSGDDETTTPAMLRWRSLVVEMLREPGARVDMRAYTESNLCGQRRACFTCSADGAG